MKVTTNRGQALTETLVSMLALVPIFVLLPYVGKYIDVKDKAIATSRYMAWERTVLSDPGASWGAGENQRSDSLMTQEAGARILGDPRQPILSSIDNLPIEGITRNPLWVDYQGGDLVSLEAYRRDPADPGRTRVDPVAAEAGATLNEESAPQIHGVTVELLAFSDDVFGFDLNQDGFVTGRVTLPAVPMPEFGRRGVAIDIQFPEEAAQRLSFSQRGGILTDAWIPGSEDNYTDRIDGAVTDEILQLIVLPGTFTFGNTLFFNEGAKGQDPQLETESQVIPPKYIDLSDPQ